MYRQNGKSIDLQNQNSHRMARGGNIITSKNRNVWDKTIVWVTYVLLLWPSLKNHIEKLQMILVNMNRAEALRSRKIPQGKGLPSLQVFDIIWRYWKISDFLYPVLVFIPVAIALTSIPEFTPGFYVTSEHFYHLHDGSSNQNGPKSHPDSL